MTERDIQFKPIESGGLAWNPPGDVPRYKPQIVTLESLADQRRLSRLRSMFELGVSIDPQSEFSKALRRSPDNPHQAYYRFCIKVPGSPYVIPEAMRSQEEAISAVLRSHMQSQRMSANEAFWINIAQGKVMRGGNLLALDEHIDSEIMPLVEGGIHNSAYYLLSDQPGMTTKMSTQPIEANFEALGAHLASLPDEAERQKALTSLFREQLSGAWQETQSHTVYAYDSMLPHCARRASEDCERTFMLGAAHYFSDRYLPLLNNPELTRVLMAQGRMFSDRRTPSIMTTAELEAYG